MTYEERLRKACDILKGFRREQTMGEAMNRLESEIIKPAIEAEREACAKIVEEKGRGLMDCSMEYRAMGHTLAANAESIAAAALELLAKQIRARSANLP